MADFENGLPSPNVDMSNAKIESVVYSADSEIDVGVQSVLYKAEEPQGGGLGVQSVVYKTEDATDNAPSISSILYATSEIERRNYMSFI